MIFGYRNFDWLRNDGTFYTAKDEESITIVYFTMLILIQIPRERKDGEIKNNVTAI